MNQERIRPIGPDEFSTRAAEFVNVYADAMEQTSPWKEMDMLIAREKSTQRMKLESEEGVSVMIAEKNGVIVGGTRFHAVTPDAIRASDIFLARENLADFLENIGRAHDIPHFYNIDDTFVAPGHQGEGIATNLRQALLQKIADEHPKGAIVITAHLSTNPYIIRSSHSFGFSETGIRIPSEVNPDVHTQYWYKILPPRDNI